MRKEEDVSIDDWTSETIEKRRKEGYELINDLEVEHIVIVCENCDEAYDIESCIIAKNNKIISLACPSCLSTKLRINDNFL